MKEVLLELGEIKIFYCALQKNPNGVIIVS